MNNELQIVTGEDLLASIDDGTNRLFINSTEIDSSNWVGSGTYTTTISGHNISIVKIDSLDGNIGLKRLSEYNYELFRYETGSITADDVIGLKSFIEADDINVADNYATFTEASSRTNIDSGDSLKVIFGKIKKFFSDLKTVAFTGAYADLTGQPTIPAAQVNTDWNATSGVAELLHKPSLASVATSGDYEDLNNKLKIFYNDSRCSDLNIDVPTLFDNGYRVYSQIVPSNAANRPDNRGDGYYVMFIWDTGHYGTQFFINQTDKDISVRRYYQDAWQPWSTFNSFQPTFNNNGWYYKPLGDGWYELWGKKENLSITFGTSFGGLWYAASGGQTFNFPFTVDNVFGLEATIKGTGSIFGCYVSNYGTTSAKVECWAATQNVTSSMAVHLHCIVHKA